MYVILKVAAALLVAAGGLTYFVGFHSVSATLAFDEVARPLSEAHTLAYRMTTQVAGAKEPISVRVLFKEPGRVRFIRKTRGSVTRQAMPSNQKQSRNACVVADRCTWP